MAYKGNAAGNTKDPLNLTGANTEVPTSDYGYVLYPFRLALGKAMLIITSSATYPPTTPVVSRKRDPLVHPYSPRSNRLWERTAEYDLANYE